jgi:transcriptional regulator with XRE-family HTH domain
MPRRIHLYQAAAFGAEVRRLRLLAGLSLHELAERAGVTPNYLGMIELGKRNPSVAVIEAIARGLHVAPGELLGGTTLGPKALEFARLFQSVPEDLRGGILKLLRGSSAAALRRQLRGRGRGSVPGDSQAIR